MSGTCSSPTSFPPPGRAWNTRTSPPAGPWRSSASAPWASSPPDRQHLGQRVIGVDPVPERREMAARHGVETLDFTKASPTNSAR